MAKATKKKTVKSAKRVVKTTVKPAIKAAQANQAAWTKQSAKLLPFGQGGFVQTDMGEAAERAAAVAQEATESMMRAGSDMMQQWWSAAQSAGNSPEAVAATTKKNINDAFGNLPGFDPAQAQEKLASFSRESVEQLSKSAGSYSRLMGEAMDMTRQHAETLVEVSNIAVALSKEISAELVSFGNKSFSQNVELSKQVLACRTLNDMFDLGSRFMKTNLDSFFSESVKLSELMFQASTDVSEPLNERFTESSERLSKALAA